MMNSSQPQLTSLPERDQELLSAYLDNQLGVAERVSLERRLTAEPALRVELEALRETAAALRALKPVRPPRSFTLDPATVSKPRFYLPVAWVMQLGSGFAGLALVLLATVQLISVGAAPAAMSVKEAPAAATEAPMALEAAPQAAESGAAMTESAAGAPGAPAADSARQLEATAAPAATEAPAAVPPPLPTADPAAAAPAAPAATQTPLPTAAPTVVAEYATGASAAEAPPQPAGGSVGPAGGIAGGPASNSAPPAGAIQPSGSSSPGTADLPAAAEGERRAQGFPPGLTLAIGAALIGLGLVWHLYSRRRT